MNKILLTTILLLLLLTSVCGCSKEQQYSPTQFPEFKLKEDIENSIKTINNETIIIEEKSENIQNESQKIYDGAIIIESSFVEDKSKIEPYLDNIKNSSKIIIKDSKEIIKANLSIQEVKNILKSAEDKISTSNKLIEKIIKERDKALKDKEDILKEKNSQLHKTLQWLITGCIIGCGAFIILFFFTGSKAGLFASGGCGLVLMIAIFVDKYITYLAIGGGVLLLIMAGILVYNIYIKNKAFSEVVSTVEITKQELSPESKIKIFGEKKKIGETKKIQSPSTEVEIKKIKLKNKFKNLLKI